ncbi:hypothetical protein B0H14DRAFT_3857839 [Mycena olivaceomarginata]|nr:hypothetical protein B0H14DRAFT_3857839 [Mycena olivaceomarginata]
MSVLPTSIDCHVPAPSAAAIHLERSSSVHSTTNPVDDFFGYSLTSSRTRDSRHDRRISVAESLAPPPYMDAPEYTEHAREPVTLAMYLFKFGFLFPPFWIFGIVILLSPLRAPPAATPSAARCLYALVTLVLVAAIIGVAVWAAHRS